MISSQNSFYNTIICEHHHHCCKQWITYRYPNSKQKINGGVQKSRYLNADRKNSNVNSFVKFCGRVRFVIIMHRPTCKFTRFYDFFKMQSFCSIENFDHWFGRYDFQFKWNLLNHSPVISMQHFEFGVSFQLISSGAPFILSCLHRISHVYIPINIQIVILGTYIWTHYNCICKVNAPF